jgi:hypothetical protein
VRHALDTFDALKDSGGKHTVASRDSRQHVSDSEVVSQLKYRVETEFSEPGLLSLIRSPLCFR